MHPRSKALVRMRPDSSSDGWTTQSSSRDGGAHTVSASDDEVTFRSISRTRRTPRQQGQKALQVADCWRERELRGGRNRRERDEDVAMFSRAWYRCRACRSDAQGVVEATIPPPTTADRTVLVVTAAVSQRQHESLATRWRVRGAEEASIRNGDAPQETGRRRHAPNSGDRDSETGRRR
ncbi:hypothetical protein L226DRAFT_368228 [Lentinus tigrinus ALCF2SS1-7]|uniref:Uncharacterized protein n=1 Tax=Lentinus tigrinus ALCF2SS1-6 TaxID=1328759 RepID=A0A5C2RPP3_9APHY|nr:hypothetical protein L227DRAFT_427190 [Lentinus tigrinus ALCF2SS1-6]RPD68119.1 hypothetical protein L226DRAFT_368228 [Lentinus tigrinus ALCF2SS1-7]